MKRNNLMVFGCENIDRVADCGNPMSAFLVVDMRCPEVVKRYITLAKASSEESRTIQSNGFSGRLFDLSRPLTEQERGLLTKAYAANHLKYAKELSVSKVSVIVDPDGQTRFEATSVCSNVFETPVCDVLSVIGLMGKDIKNIWKVR